MDRNRLNEVRQTDLTESRVNEGFVDWLKNKGPGWLLAGLVVLLAWVGIIRWKERQFERRAEAWTALNQADLPTAYEAVASEYGGVGAVADLARLRAAETLLRSVQRNRPVSFDPATEPDTRLAPEDRDINLSRADTLFADLIDEDDGSLEKSLVVISALNGRAAVAECRGDLERAAEFYQQAATRAEEHFPRLSEQALARANSLSEMVAPPELPSDADIETLVGTPEPRTPLNVEPAFRDVIYPPDDSAG